MTISLAVIMLEVTNSMNYVVPVMLAVLVAKTVADALEKKGIYDLVIEWVDLSLHHCCLANSFASFHLPPLLYARVHQL